MEPIKFEVSYQLGEYRSMVSEHLLFRHNRRLREKSPNARISFRLPLSTRLAFVVLVPLIFWNKVRKVGRCTFLIDEQGVQRTSKLGTGRVPWADVVTVHRLSRAYLVEKRNGALPLPYRCLDERQKADLEEFLKQEGVAVAEQSGTGHGFPLDSRTPRPNANANMVID